MTSTFHMLVNIKFDIVSEKFSKWMYEIRINSFAKTVTDIELAIGSPPDVSMESEVPMFLKQQISDDTGIEHKYIRVEKKWLSKDIYKVKFLDEGAALMFKLVYYGEGI